MSKLKGFIEAMPKCELHVHIEGTLEPEMKFQLAKRNGVKLPYKNEKALKAAYDFDDLPSFLAVYYEGMSVLLTGNWPSRSKVIAKAITTMAATATNNRSRVRP